jgi:hypothetical protein
MAFRVAHSDTAPNTMTVDIQGSGLTGLQIGDVMIACILYCDSTNNITPPSGWTSFGTTQQIKTADGVSNTGNFRTYWRVAESGDTAATWTWTMTVNQTHIGVICAFSGRNATAPITASAGFMNTASQATIDAPNVTAAEGDDIVVFAGITMTGLFSVTGGSLTEYKDVTEGTGGDATMTAAGEDEVTAGSYTAGVFTQNQVSGWHRMAAITVAVASGTQVLLPDADLDAAGWTTSPLYSKLNDGSDATFITQTAS